MYATVSSGREAFVLRSPLMTENILALLVAERDKLNRAIEALQVPIKRRGRPSAVRSTRSPLETLGALDLVPAVSDIPPER
jgi:hypothetical protein